MASKINSLLERLTTIKECDQKNIQEKFTYSDILVLADYFDVPLSKLKSTFVPELCSLFLRTLRKKRKADALESAPKRLRLTDPSFHAGYQVFKESSGAGAGAGAPGYGGSNTKTQVVCVSAKNLGSVKLEDWLQMPGNVYIGRKNVFRRKSILGKNKDNTPIVKYTPVPEVESVWANPFTMKSELKAMSEQDQKTMSESELEAKARSLVLSKYKAYITQKIKSNPTLYNIGSLKGKKLGCWCAPSACHGDILKSLADSS